MKERHSICHICGSGELEMLDRCALAASVTSDCKPFAKPVRIGVCRSCHAVVKPWGRDFEDACQRIYRDYSIYQLSGGAEQGVFTGGVGTPRSRLLVGHLAGKGFLGTQGTLLDIGCGNGAFLRALAERLPSWRTAGMELDDAHSAEVLSLATVEDFFTDLDTVGKQYDALSLIHVLEHVAHPAAFLARMVRLLKPAGCLIVEVPYYRRNPFDLMIFDHCTHFDQQSCVAVINAAGFEVVSLATDVVDREMTVVARPGSRSAASPGLPQEVEAEGMSWSLACRGVEWLQGVAEVLTDASLGGAQVGVFGSSIAANWLFAECPGAVSFFVDEDANRIGGRLNGCPVRSPLKVLPEDMVVLPFVPDVAAAIRDRLVGSGIRGQWLLPPPLRAH